LVAAGDDPVASTVGKVAGFSQQAGVAAQGLLVRDAGNSYFTAEGVARRS